MFESLESLAISARSYDKRLSTRASNLMESLRKAAPPAYGTRLRKGTGRNLRFHSTTTMYHLFIDDLTDVNRSALDECLVSLKGMVSFVVDVAEQKCTIRISPKLALKTVLERLQRAAGMRALVMTKNRETGTTDYVDVLNETNKTLPLDYLVDEETPPKKHALYNYTNHLARNASGFLQSATDLWNRSFYW
ncbi:PREDICTED: armadillo repeat-containing protein 1-like [Nicrophorus vespilloides]|uniref:Armadillo repeat-containing protein 1-like n=1 Tax=Nicrophorus vespilloides TaxID=110193 RepID=A0ABM1M051_NICVS|nr:PREDICTED: armadillo repeat-containing protein 1-like [Nicrophorus vespilloides]